MMAEKKLSSVLLSLQSRMTPFRAIRRSISMYALKTPESIYDAPTIPSSSNTSSTAVSEIDPDGFADDTIVEKLFEDRLPIMPSASGSTTPTLPEPATRAIVPVRRLDVVPAQTESGINRRFKAMGFQLLRASEDEASKKGQPGYDPSFERKAYVDGLSYLIRAVPNHLSEAETKNMEDSLPAALKQPRDPNVRTFSRREQSILHRIVRTVVMYLIVLAHWILPYLSYLYQLAARTERKYKISENMVRQGMVLASNIGRQSTNLTAIISNITDGPVGRVVTGAAAWTVEGVVGGVSDGVGEGLSMVLSNEE
jgi:hypothetical protein